ncbi:uncharacterized protein CANTADRAFT_91902 [Suhomyces tanzawaensis NRRL Y-17324]|uniref:RGS domain-containing protein n=1 Tax=Suhomyces tanzawaensis NRRL Y-17324 TaxID=984487 RepID=A0A1E4SDI3_9ASCO|nr:uncharacterized protein CANTADRAFT_91902 [Suhomyces tanzawaensis NRRL Y-17324]ODV77452.1 hypothetical protein CANTADRAFT_91902 [Suhomyces tanzawaensis NRRL Y-17324]
MNNPSGGSSQAPVLPAPLPQAPHYLFQYPIPTKPSSLNSQYAYVASPPTSKHNNDTSSSPHVCSGPPSLDDIVNQCFLRAINHPTDATKQQCVAQFERLVAKLHCQENLRFLIEVYKYEYYYDRIFPFVNTNHTSKPRRDRLNNTPSPSISQYLHSDHMRKTPSKDDLNAFYSNSINTSINNLNLAAPESVDDVFVSTIDDLGTSQELSEQNTKAWDDMFQRNVNEDLEDDEDHNDVHISDFDQDILSSQWGLIISNYIVNDAPEQINLSEQLYKEILLETNVDCVHPPGILLKAKNEVLQLIKENAYLTYLHQHKSEATASPITSPPLSVSAPPPQSPATSLGPSLQSPISKLQASPSSLKFDPHHDDPIVNVPKAASTIASPLLSPTTSHTQSHSKSKKKRFLHKPTPTHTVMNEALSSNSSSSSSISNLLGHLKLYHNHHTHGASHSPNFLHSVSTTLHSLSGSPMHDDDEPSGSGLKFWSKKKHDRV